MVLYFWASFEMEVYIPSVYSQTDWLICPHIALVSHLKISIFLPNIPTQYFLFFSIIIMPSAKAAAKKKAEVKKNTSLGVKKTTKTKTKKVSKKAEKKKVAKTTKTAAKATKKVAKKATTPIVKKYKSVINK